MKKQFTLLATAILIACNPLKAQLIVQNTTIPDKPEVVFVQGATFTMGDGSDADNPSHAVTLNTYSIGKYPITVGQYRAFCKATGIEMPEAPKWGWMDKNPMVNINYNEAIRYCNWLGEEYGGEWRLPTEAEWEYAARGGNKSNGYTYSGGNNLDQVGWYADNAGEETNTVGRKKPNELGIYDMSGNVWEWCRDWYGKDYYANSPKSNPKGPSSGSYRVLRGGSWDNTASNCRVAARINNDPPTRYDNFGFRVVLSQ